MPEFFLPYASIQGRFMGNSWEDTAEWFEELHRDHEGFEGHSFLRDILASVIAHGMTDRLGLVTSMHDLVIVSLETRNGAYETIKVLAPYPGERPVDDGCFAMSFFGRKRRKTGRREIRQFPIEEAVPSFWAFVDEKFGIKPGG